MGYYVIGIGGTGAKCIESLVHLAAAGLMPDSGELQVLFVDPDTANGSRARVEETIAHYVACKDQLDLGQTDLLQTNIKHFDPILWTPFDKTNPSLKQFFQYANFQDSAAGKLFDVLYSRSEKDCSLEEGFRGHPSIGSAVMAKSVDLNKDETWIEFSKRIKNDDGDAKVFLAGSIFGGTGASGFPTIAQIIRDELDVKLGGALILPYFKFIDDGIDGQLKARSDEFLMNTQTALKHYHLLDKTGVYDKVYLFGDESRTDVKNALGGPEQKNAPHFIELYAALAAIDFFGGDFGDDGNTQYFMTAREVKNRLQWTDLPDVDNGDTVRSRIGQLARFSFTYLSVYYPALKNIANRSSDAFRSTWYVNFFERTGTQIDEAIRRLDFVVEYTKDFLLWLANIQGNCSEEEKIELTNYGPYAERKPDGNLDLKSTENFSTNVSHLIQSQTEAESDVLNKLWERMCDSRRKGHGDAQQNLGTFLRALYENCGK